MYMVSSSENLKKFMTAEIGGIPHKDLLNQLTNELFTNVTLTKDLKGIFTIFQILAFDCFRHACYRVVSSTTISRCVALPLFASQEICHLES